VVRNRVFCPEDALQRVEAVTLSRVNARRFLVQLSQGLAAGNWQLFLDTVTEDFTF
jgi:hypothetical protein